jgi:hypothetical protein
MRRCWFCDSAIIETTASREHVVPQWLQKHLGITTDQIEPTLTSMPDGAELKKRRHPVSQLKTGGICGKCNNGWMSALENTVTPILIPLIDQTDDLSSLKKADRLAVGRWAAKTAYALDAGGLEPHVPSEHFRQLPDMPSGLPVGVTVFGIQQTPTKKWFYAGNASWSHPSLTPEAQQQVVDRSYKFALQFGHLIVVIAYWPLPGWNLRIEKSKLVKVWPPTSQVAVYEHPHPMTSETSEDACLRYTIGITVSPTKTAVGRGA